MANLTGPTNNLFSNMMVQSKQPEPVLGMGATICLYTDRYAATVVEINRFKTGKRAGMVSKVVVQEDNAKRADTNGMSDSQDYTYTPDPNGRRFEFNVNAKGKFLGDGFSLSLGNREKYHDYSF